MIKWQEIDLQQARDQIRIGGQGCLIGAYTIGASVTPVIQLVQNDKTDFRVSIPIVLRQAFKEIKLTNAAGVGTLLVGISADPCDAISLSGGGAGGDTTGFFNAYWHPHEALTVGDPAALSWMTPNGIFVNPPFWIPFTAGAGFAPIITIRNVPVYITRPNGGNSGLRYGLGNMPWIRLRTNVGAGGGVLNVSPDLAAQSWTFSFLFRKEQNVFTKAQQQGFFFIPAGAALPGMPSGNNACFGICMDGVNGWQFVVRTLTGSPFVFNQPFAIPGGDATRINRATFQLINADPLLGRNGIVRFYLNGAKLFDFSGADIPLFPGTWDSNGAGTETGYAFCMTDEGASVDALNVAQVRVRSWAGEGTVAE